MSETRQVESEELRTPPPSHGPRQDTIVSAEPDVEVKKKIGLPNGASEIPSAQTPSGKRIDMDDIDEPPQTVEPSPNDGASDDDDIYETPQQINDEFDEFDTDVDWKNRLTIRYTLENFAEKREEAKNSDDKKRLVSPIYTSPDGRKWKLLIFPYGLNREGNFSVYLKLEDTSSASNPTAVHKCKFWISVENQKRMELLEAAKTNQILFGSRIDDEDDKPAFAQKSLGRSYQDSTRKCTDEFFPGNKDWGFVSLASPMELNKESGLLGEDGSLVIRSTVIPVTDWSKYSSKDVTGKVGLENHGATCYLNSLLQTLFMTKNLRLAVYNLETGQEKRNSGIGLELQRLFWLLQTSDRAVSTRPLTTAFGWDSNLLFRQHDVQEMNRELVDKLEARLAKTPQEGLMKKLYTGQTKSYIRCLNVDFTSAREEEYYDIQLDVKNMNDVYEAFEKYIEEEKLEGENQYEADGYGKQDAMKGVGFISFPPVLNLHLKRFEYDVRFDTTVKINDSFKFPVRLELDRFQHKDVPRSEVPEYEYILHSVLVHVGDVNAGHYYAYINDLVRKPGTEHLQPTTTKEILDLYDSRWFKFDDENVTIARKSHAVNQNYGGNFGVGHRLGSGLGNAYMLVYIQISKLDEVLVDVPDSKVPRSLLDRFEKDKEDEKLEFQIAEHNRTALSVAYVTEAHLLGFDSYGKHPTKVRYFVDFADFLRVPKINLRKDNLIPDLYQSLAEEMQIPQEAIRLWICCKRENFTTRPDSVLDRDNQETPLSQMDQTVDGFCVYVEVAKSYKQGLVKEDMPNSDKDEDEPSGDIDQIGGNNGDMEERSRKKMKPSFQFLSPDTHILLFIREFFPDGGKIGEKIRHRGSLLIPRSLKCSDFVRESLAPFLRSLGDTAVSSEWSDYKLWELWSAVKAKVMVLDDMEDEGSSEGSNRSPLSDDGRLLVNAFELQHGDILVFERLGPDRSAGVLRDSSKKSKVGSVVIDGKRIHNYSSLLEMKTPQQSLIHTINVRVVTFFEYEERDPKNAIHLQINLVHKRDGMTSILAKTLLEEDAVERYLVSNDFSANIALYRPSGKFKLLEQARPLSLISDSDATTLTKKLIGFDFSGWEVSMFGQESQRTLFYEILPCSFLRMNEVYEVHYLGDSDTYPNYRKILVHCDEDKSIAADKPPKNGNLATNFTKALCLRLGTEEPSQLKFRWVVVNNREYHVLPSSSGTKTIFPSLYNVRSSFENLPKLVVADIIHPDEPELEKATPEEKWVDEETNLVILVHVHMDANVPRRFGKPFSLILKKGDTRMILLEKVRKRLRLEVTHIQDWKVGLFALESSRIAWVETDNEPVLEPTKSAIFAANSKFPVIALHHAMEESELRTEIVPPARRLDRRPGKSPMIAESAIQRE